MKGSCGKGWIRLPDVAREPQTDLIAMSEIGILKNGASGANAKEAGQVRSIGEREKAQEDEHDWSLVCKHLSSRVWREGLREGFSL